MTVAVEAYLIISAINLGLMLSGAGIAVVSKHALMAWRLNKPQVPAQKTP